MLSCNFIISAFIILLRESSGVSGLPPPKNKDLMHLVHSIEYASHQKSLEKEPYIKNSNEQSNFTFQQIKPSQIKPSAFSIFYFGSSYCVIIIVYTTTRSYHSSIRVMLNNAYAMVSTSMIQWMYVVYIIVYCDWRWFTDWMYWMLIAWWCDGVIFPFHFGLPIKREVVYQMKLGKKKFYHQNIVCHAWHNGERKWWW